MSDILGQLGEAFVLLRADGSELSKDMEKEKKKLEKDLEKWGGHIESLGKGMSVMITAPLVALGAAALYAGQEIDDAFDKIRIGTGASGAKLQDLRHSFKNVFHDLPDDADKVSTAITEISKRTGATGAQLEQLARQELDLSRITKTDLNTNVATSSRLFASWQITTDKQSDALDFLFKVSQSTGVGVTDLMMTVNDFGPILRQFGFSFEESATMIGQWTKAGLTAEQMLGSMRVAAKHFAEAGVPMKEGLEKTLAIMQKLGPGTEQSNVAIKVFGRSGLQMADAINRGQLSVKDLLDQLRKSPETIGNAVKATEGFKEQLIRLKNEATLALEPLGTKLLALGEKGLPVLLKMGDTVIGMAEKFSKLPGPVQEFAIALGAVLAAAGPVIFAAGTLISNFGAIAGFFGAAGTAAATAGTTIGGMGLAATAASVGLTLIGVAIAGWALYKIAEAGSLILDLRNQSVQAAKDMQNAQEQGNRMIQIAFEKTGIKAKEAADAQRILTAYSSGLRGEQIKGVASTSLQYQAWEKGKEIADQKSKSVSTLKGHTKDLGDANLKLASTENKTADAAAKALLNQLGLNKGEDEAAKKAKEYQDALKKLIEQMSGTEATTSAKMYVSALTKVGTVTGLTKKETQEAMDALHAAMDKMRVMGTTTSVAFKQAEKAYDSLKDHLQDVTIKERLEEIQKSFSGDELKANASAYIEYLDSIGTTTGMTREETQKAADTLHDYIGRMRVMGDTTSEAFLKAQTAYGELVAHLRDVTIQDKIEEITKAFSGDEIKANAEAYVGYLSQIGTTTGLTGEETKKIIGELDDYLERMRLLGDTTGDAFAKVQAARDKLDLEHTLPSTHGIAGVDMTKIVPPVISKSLKKGFDFRTIGEQLKDGILAPLKNKEFGAEIGKVMVGAFQGGGDVGKSVGGFIGNSLGSNINQAMGKFITGKLGGQAGKFLGGAIGSIIPGVGTMLGSLLGDYIGKGLSAMASKLGKIFKGLFGPSEKELKGRESVHGVDEALKSSLSESQQKELAAVTAKGQAWAGNDLGAAKAIALRDAFVAAGHTEREGMDWAAKLDAATKKGPDEVKKVVADIKAIIGDRIPGFKFGSGGLKDFGGGTLAMLHGKEAVLRQDQFESMVNLNAGPGSSYLAQIMSGMIGNKGDGGTVHFEPHFHSLLTSKDDWMNIIRTKMWPDFLKILEIDGQLRAEVATKLGGLNG